MRNTALWMNNNDVTDEAYSPSIAAPTAAAQQKERVSYGFGVGK